MISADQMREMLEGLLDELPEVFFQELNGGVNLWEDTRLDPAARNEDLYVLGEYSVDPYLGRAIFLYYGSFQALFGGASKKTLHRELRKTLRHEFRHHMESLAGENGLELEDAQQMAKYLQEGG